jgi:drug/metabolite transporter (DMT)-like permease
MLLSLPILLYFSRQLRHELAHITRRDLGLIFLQSVMGVFLFNALLLYALRYTTAAESGIITSTTPALIGIISWLFLKEQLNVLTSSGILLTILGTVAINVLTAELQLQRGPNPLLGNVLVMIAAVGEALFTIFRKATASRVSPMMNASLVTLFGLLCFLVPGIVEGLRFKFQDVNPSAWLTLIYYALSVNVFAYILWFRAVPEVPASTAGVFTGVLPISIVVLSALILDENIGVAHIFGLVCVVCGIFLVTYPQWSHKPSIP